MVTNENALRASYETMRMTILTAYRQNPNSFAPAYVYAWANRMPAVGLANAESVFWRSDNMRIVPEIVRRVEETVNNLIAKGHLESLAYDRLSNKPGVMGVAHYLATILGYFSLKGDYSLEVKNALRVNMPSDKSLVTTFGPEMISFPS
ncbi:hypothetical protein OIU34_20050 [Pararhizobium sp. BT-229]|uniref:hypothetical protein n=1 Tax=Pararhizobium sp. BT-229 TaxID=2986923 RepID=UPI0021F789E9|nr:hypothetical protein [Pararhizobium sp. BT-229]MCV9964180.1 hypothetical protein [Pararhizobium sp. BT-229]